jgi:hypothetical protein
MLRLPASLCLVSSALLGVALGPAAAQTPTPDALARHVLPLSKPVLTPKILIDVSDAPELFEKSTGKNLDALWAEFLTTLPARPAQK